MKIAIYANSRLGKILVIKIIASVERNLGFARKAQGATYLHPMTGDVGIGQAGSPSGDIVGYVETPGQVEIYVFIRVLHYVGFFFLRAKLTSHDLAGVVKCTGAHLAVAHWIAGLLLIGFFRTLGF